MPQRYFFSVHGSSVQVEYADRVVSVERRGFGATVTGRDGTSNWFHFAVPTPQLVPSPSTTYPIGTRCIAVNVHASPSSASVVRIRSIHLYDDNAVYHMIDGITVNGFWSSGTITGTRQVAGALGVTIGVDFTNRAGAKTVEFRGVSVGFETMR
jgi:hypothetical protein